MSSLILGVAVAVSATQGAFGKHRFLQYPMSRYVGRKSCPHLLTQWHSSTATIIGGGSRDDETCFPCVCSCRCCVSCRRSYNLPSIGPIRDNDSGHTKINDAFPFIARSSAILGLSCPLPRKIAEIPFSFNAVHWSRINEMRGLTTTATAVAATLLPLSCSIICCFC